MSTHRHKVSIYGGSVKLSPTFEIVYQCENNTPCVVWDSVCAGELALTLFKSPSGSGKTTLLSHLFGRLSGRLADEGLRFDFTPDFDRPETAAVAVIPQNPPMVNHWKLTEILPKQPKFLGSFLPKESVEPSFWKKRVGEFSGGQRRKLYTCSALERLASQTKEHSFLLLDETFDGLGATEAKRCLLEIRTQWAALVQKPLYLLLVTHLNDTEIIDDNVTATTLGLKVEDSSAHCLTVKLVNSAC